MTDGSGVTLAPAGRAGPNAPPWCSRPLLLTADPAGLEAIADYVRAVAVRCEVGEEAAYRLRLAVEELAANAVLHGYAGRPGYLRVVGGADADRAWITLADSAPAFAPSTARREPQRGVPVAEREVGGLGIHLALSAADAYAYEYAGGENRSTVFVRRRTGKERAT